MAEKTLKELQAEYVEEIKHLSWGDQALLSQFSFKKLEALRAADSHARVYAITNHLVEAARLLELIKRREVAIEAYR